MHQTIEAVIGQQGQIKILENFQLPKGRRVLVTILDEVVPVPSARHKQGSSKKRIFGQHKGEFRIASDFDEPLSDEFWMGKTPT